MNESQQSRVGKAGFVGKSPNLIRYSGETAFEKFGRLLHRSQNFPHFSAMPQATMKMKILALLTVVPAATLAIQVGSSSLVPESGQENVLCRVVVLDSSFSDSTSDEEPACIPIVDGIETDSLVSLELPVDVFFDDANEVEDPLYVSITNASLQNDTIQTTTQSQFLVVPALPHARRLAFDKPKTVVMVRISTKDLSPTFTTDQLEDFLDAPINFISQFRQCSIGQLQFQSVGVFDVVVNEPIVEFGGKSGALVRAAQEQLKLDLQLGSITDLADRILFCLPPAFGTFVAAAALRHWRAVFHDKWCLSLSATAHELGHTLGLSHSNQNGIKYGDRSGYMSKSFRSSTYPFRCFNGEHNYRLGWYAARTLEVDATAKPLLVRLAAFVDYVKTTSDEPVLVNIDDGLLFLQYNRAKTFNDGTGECADQVTITNTSKTGSELLACLSVGQKFDREGVQVQVCRNLMGNKDTADIMVIDIGFVGGAPSCDESKWETAEPTLVPTDMPSHAPTNFPVQHPTIKPVNTLTAQPTVAPVHGRTPAPTKRDTQDPESDENSDLWSFFQWLMTWWKNRGV